MRGLLSAFITRPLQRLMILATIGTMLAFTASASNRVHDSKFDAANLAVRKAQILLGAPVCARIEAMNAEACDKVLKKALDRLDRALATINEAAGDVSLAHRP